MTQKTAMKILVVEDGEIDQTVAKHFLTELGCLADIATSGHDALKIIENSTYDLIFMDLQLADIDGFNVAKRIHGMGQQVPIVILTAFGKPSIKKRALALGLEDFISKPLTLESCQRVLSKYRNKLA